MIDEGRYMKAAVFYGPGDLRLEQRPVPDIADNELLLKTAACAVCGSDVRTFRFGASNITQPVIIGHEISGTIERIGRSLSAFSRGQRVAVAPAVPCGICSYCRRGIETMCDDLRSIGYQFNGGFAEYMVVPHAAINAGCVNTIPDGVSFEEAAAAEPLACVINAQELLNVGADDTVVVLGAGPVGCLHVSVARVRGARSILLAEINAERLQRAGRFDGVVLIDAAASDVKTHVLAATNGHGASVVIVAAPSARAQEQALTLAAKRGRVCFFGGLPKSDPWVRLNANLIHYRELFVVGAYGSRPAHNREALDLIASGRVRVAPLLEMTLPLEELRLGLDAIAAGKVLKVVVRP
jgi:L-iditol 2-dehydrogenase